MGKKLLSLLLALVMVVMVLPVTALAAPKQPTYTVSVTPPDGEVQVGEPATFSVKISVKDGDLNQVTGLVTCSENGQIQGNATLSVSDKKNTEQTWIVSVIFNEKGDGSVAVSFKNNQGELAGGKDSVNVVIVCKHPAKLTKVDSQAASCTETGNTEYWMCERCGACFAEDDSTGEEKDASAFDLHRHPNVVEEEDNGTCLVKGHNAHLRCTECDACFEIGEVEFAEGSEKTLEDFESEFGSHSMSALIPAEDPTCQKDGHVEGYYCDVCKTHFADLDGNTVIVEEDWTIPAGEEHHAKSTDPEKHHEATASTCQKTGNVEYWECAYCTATLNADGTVIDVITPINPDAHTPGEEEVGATPATCTEPGVLAHYECACGARVNIDGKEFDTTDPVKGHLFGDLVPEQTGTCKQNYIEAHYECTREGCGKWFKEDKTTEITNQEGTPADVTNREVHELETVNEPYEHQQCKNCGAKFVNGEYVEELPHQHELEPVYAIPAFCTTPGRKAYYKCTDEECGQCFETEDASDAPKTEDYFVIPAHHENPEMVKEIHITGNDYIYYCVGCGQFYADKNCTSITEAPSAEGCKHPVAVRHEEAPATCVADGYAQTCFECPICGQYFAEKKPNNGSKPLTDVVIPQKDVEDPASHEFTIDVEYAGSTYKRCNLCGRYLVDGKVVEDLSGVNCEHKGEKETFEKREATCSAWGVLIDCWICEDCNRCFDKETGKELDFNKQCYEAPRAGSTDPKDHELVLVGEGEDEHYMCSHCDMTFAKDQVDPPAPAHEHKLVEVAAVPGTCVDDGYEACWQCEDEACGKYFKTNDPDGEAFDDVEFANIGKDATNHVNIVTAEEDDEHYAYEHCTECGCYWMGDSEVSEEDTLKPAAPVVHQLIYVGAKAATCEEDGNIAYWRCVECGDRFASRNSTAALTDEEVIIKGGHHFVDCFGGNSGKELLYKECSVCGYLVDVDGNEVDRDSLNGTDHKKHVFVVHPAAIATCTTQGNIEYAVCLLCPNDVYYNPQNGKQLNAQDVFQDINPDNHVLEEYMEDFYRCKNCGALFSKNEGATDGSTIKVGKHELVKHSAVASTCATYGYIEYYECVSTNFNANGHTTCAKYFKDAQAQEPLTADQLRLNELAEHTWVHVDAVKPTEDHDGCMAYDYCSVCGKIKLDDGTEMFPGEDGFDPNVPFDPENPDGGETDPENPDPENPDPENPDPENPDPEKPDPENPEVGCTHKVGYHKETPATCSSIGRKAYWFCDTCKLFFEDEAKTRPTTWAALEIPATGVHSPLIHVPRNEAEGTIEYWYCSMCGKRYSDAEGKNPITDINIPEQPPVETKPVIKDDMDLSGMHMSSILGKGNEP